MVITNGHSPTAFVVTGHREDMRFRRVSEAVTRFLRNSPKVMVSLLALALVAVLVWLLGPGPKWMLTTFDVNVSKLDPKDLTTAVDAIRGRVLAVATGLVALVAVYYTARNAATARRTLELSEQNYRSTVEMSDRTYRLSEQGHVTDRYTKAIEQLGSEKLDIRLGGIYALERIAHDSARDHPTIIEVLAAFVREHSHDPDASATARHIVDRNGKNARPKIRTDIQAALTAIGRRTTSHDQSDRGINLSDADLTGAEFRGANLAGADLSYSNFTGTFFYSSDFAQAFFIKSNFTNAIIRSSNVTGANFASANFTSAELTGLDFTNAIIGNAIFTNAEITGAVGLSERLARPDEPPF
ncbi:pentapeptide repeat-containing protein [Streptosporangium subroseum]|uniref:pentapeptide repeat-containing protein n=1 Tax=Streptosporangium subroseum TaxID=106412 RepID=UPI00308C21DB|nr:pentapeptide repeat-containing protein [Streptosporangium subroseum]